ncbi:amino acid synthesis family protein [Minwuia sp.]|uniref:amino acid synthesis family protein n=1 Tax=Minwuia sp. TaxID=2493630 RepID=UPI003A8E2B66
MSIRKTLILTERVLAEGGMVAAAPVTRVAGIAIIANPFAGEPVEDLSSLFDLGHDLAGHLMTMMLPALPGPAVSYGKAALVGVHGDIEHGHAMLHPKLGRAMREPIGGGEALIPSSAKVGAAGATLDVPLGHKDDAWSRDHFDAMPVCVPDSPRPDEIMLVIVIADGGRPAPRTGTTR